FTEISVEIDDPQAAVAHQQGPQLVQRRVRAAVVDVDYLERLADYGHHPSDLPEEGHDVARLVVDRDDDREPRRRGGAHCAAEKNEIPASPTVSTSGSLRSGKTGSERISCASRSARGSGGDSP